MFSVQLNIVIGIVLFVLPLFRQKILKSITIQSLLTEVFAGAVLLTGFAILTTPTNAIPDPIRNTPKTNWTIVPVPITGLVQSWTAAIDNSKTSPANRKTSPTLKIRDVKFQ